ncbi:hypothetical protein CI109_101943 [Kwoniella shandongensis]|uniref:Holocytochrome c-type synthase n=1 Tax=Kwoniella shandongensis TaxID=1734106 RepID=A0A5M6BU68_9TREE|nr:uncharacterized protein CI109_005397 [Kwoniella shandongensis]KAA5526273.1 hypothetical protein CI109_005397 [Kwoniella shandongensis]
MWPFTSSPASASTSTPNSAPSSAAAAAADVASADKCPVDHTTRQAWLAASSSASPHPFHPEGKAPPPTGSASRLSQDRVISSIPRAPVSHPGPSQPPSEHAIPTESAPGPGAHKDEAGNWVYPSEQQFFNAMLRKNHKPKAQDMRTVVPIHNAVNEKAWEEVLRWESPFGSERCGGPKLVSFVGKPKERTPKAWIKTALGYTPPFDRHDWLVDRCGTHVRYIIDFYTGRAGDDGKVSFYLDVRPAVDNLDGIKTRLSGWWNMP